MGYAATSTFDQNNENWAVVNGAQRPTHNPAGHICAADSGRGIWYWKAPLDFLGDVADAYNSGLTFDLTQSTTGGQFDADDVILVGGGLVLAFDTLSNPGVDGTRYRVPLEETAGWNIAGSDEEPTQEELSLVLSSVTDLLIRGEYASGRDTGCLDNVILRRDRQEPE